MARWVLMLPLGALAWLSACTENGTTAPAGPERYTGATFDVTVDPSTGVASGRVTATVRAGAAPVGQLFWLLDQGLTSFSATVNGTSATTSETVESPYRTVTITPSAPIAPGATAEVTLSYSGTVLCASPVPLQGPCDVVAGGMSRFSPSSIFPGFLTSDSEFQRAPHTVVLRTPPGADVLVSAAQTDDRMESGLRVTTWTVENALLLLPTAIIGTFTTVPLTATPRPVYFHHAPGDDAWTARLTDWLPTVVPFVESTISRSLPCSEIHLVKWPDTYTDAGYATYCLIGLRDLHEQTGDYLFEESWAHEIAHIWWGVGLLPRDKATQKVLTEGLATYTMWSYRYAQDGAGLDRDEYFAYRDREAGLMLRYVTPVAAATPVVARSPADAVDLSTHGFNETFTWEYVKTTATVDLLALLVGSDVFWRGVAAYHDNCLWRACTIDDFQASMEAAGEQDLDRFFTEWFHGSPWPIITIAHAITPEGGGQRVDVTVATDSPAAIPLELWIELADGGRVRERVMVTRPQTVFSKNVSGIVRQVRANPRHDALAFIASAVFGDLNFDGVVTAADRDLCSPLVGKKVEARFPPGGGAAYTGVDLEFDPRCDLDASGAIDAADLAMIPVP